MLTELKNRVSCSIVKQMNINNSRLISEINNLLLQADISTYDNIKILTKQLRVLFLEYSYEIKHTQVLNLLAKAIGFKNHHSLKENLFDNTDKEEITDELTHIRKFFLIKEKFFNEFNIQEWKVFHMIERGHSFGIIYERDHLSGNEKKSINRFLKENGLKRYKNMIPLFKTRFTKKGFYLQKLAYKILKEYKQFFRPLWKEKDLSLYNQDKSFKLSDWSLLSYENIVHKDSFLIVDLYSTDMPWGIVINFLEYLFNYGTLKDVKFLENSLEKIKEDLLVKEDKTQAEKIRIASWKKVMLEKEIEKNYNLNIAKTLEPISRSGYSVQIREYMREHFLSFEKEQNKNIKEIIIENCEYFYNNKEKFKGRYLPDSIIERLIYTFYKKSNREYIEELESISETEINKYRFYYDKHNSIKRLSFHIEYLINTYINVRNRKIKTSSAG